MWDGILIGLGFILILSKFPVRNKLWMTTNEVKADVIIFIAVLVIHGMIGGGVKGVVHAAIAAFVCGIYTAYLRKKIGYWSANGYQPGSTDVSSQL